jgi:hypothetical protein
MVGEASATKIDEATMAKADEAEAVQADERAALVDIGKTTAEAALMSLRTEDQLGVMVGRGKSTPSPRTSPQATWKGGDGC